jgi:hypothetical protein
MLCSAQTSGTRLGREIGYKALMQRTLIHGWLYFDCLLGSLLTTASLFFVTFNLELLHGIESSHVCYFIIRSQ